MHDTESTSDINYKYCLERLEYIELQLAQRLIKMQSTAERVAYLADLFGPRHARAEYDRLSSVHVDLMKQ